MPAGVSWSGRSHDHRRAADADADRLHLADAAVADDLDGLAEASAELAPLLAADLENDRILGDGVHDLPPFGNAVRQRLLAIDVLPGVGRQDAGDRMPMVRRGDHHGVDLLVGEQFAEVGVSWQPL